MNKDLLMSQQPSVGASAQSRQDRGELKQLALDARTSSITEINPVQRRGKEALAPAGSKAGKALASNKGGAGLEPQSAVRATSSLASQSEINPKDNQSAFNISQNPMTNRSHISGKSVTQKSQVSQRTNVTQRSQISQMPPKSGRGVGASRAGSRQGRPGGRDQAQTVEHTDVYSWGADHSGQLGLGLHETGVVDESIPGSTGKSVQPVPRYCTYGILIRDVACGLEHSAFITSDNFLYTMGSNRCGQLGIGDPNISYKNSPVLVEQLADQNDASIGVGMAGVSCGAYHTLAHTRGGDAWSWGEVRFGALGIQGETVNQFKPMRVEFASSSSEKVSVMQVAAGQRHSLFLDVYGRVYACGDNEQGQLGMSVRPNELLPCLIPNFNDVAQMIACGHRHSLILTRSGLVYAFGSNEEGQLGVPSKRSSPVPLCIQDISHVPMKYIAAGSFSASVSQDTNQLYLWGTGTFGNFHTPHRVKKIAEDVISVSIGDQFGACLTEDRKLYTWGVNDLGQLGTGDFQDFGTPSLLEKMTSDGRELNRVACGAAFTLCLSQAKQFLDVPAKSLAEYHDAKAQLVHKGIQSVRARMERQRKREKELAEAQRKAAMAPKSRIDASRTSGASANPFQSFLAKREESFEGKPHFGSQLPAAEDLERAAAAAKMEQQRALSQEKKKPRIVVTGQRSLSSSSEEDHYQQQLMMENYQEVSDEEIASPVDQRQMIIQQQTMQRPAASRTSAASSKNGKSKLTKKSASQMSQKSMKSQASGKSNLKGPTTQRSSRSQAGAGNALKKSGGPKAQPGQGKGNRPPKSMRADKARTQALVPDLQAEEKPKSPPDLAKPHSSQMSHLSVISRMTEHVAGEKFHSESSNPVSLKKSKPTTQNKENFNKDNDQSSLFKMQKVADSKTQNPAWMIDGSSKDEAQPRSIRQSLPQDVHVGGKTNSGTMHDSPFLQSAISPQDQTVASAAHQEAEILRLQSELAMLRNEKRESDDHAYREAQNAKRLSTELCSMRDQIQELQERLANAKEDKNQISQLEVEEQMATSKVRELQKETVLLRNQLKDREREVAKSTQGMLMKTESVNQIEEQVKMLQKHIEDQDQSNARYQAENAKLRREVENLKVVEEQLKTAKSQLESEKEIRTTAELDIQKMRLELSDLQAQSNRDRNEHERAMKDLKYEHEKNKNALSLKVAEIDELQKKLEYSEMTLETRDATIEELKQSIVQSEIKNRRLLEQLNAQLQQTAQSSIDNTINVLQQRMAQSQNPAREESQRRHGVVSNAQHRLNNLLKQDRPKLTPEIALQELEEKMQKEAEMNGTQSFSFNNLENTMRSGAGPSGASLTHQTPAQILSQSIDHRRWRTPGLPDEVIGGQEPPDAHPSNQRGGDSQRSEAGDRALAESQFTSTMIKQSLADLRHRLQQMKEDKDMASNLL